MVMKPADEKDDPTYVQMHSAVSQANVLKDKLAVGTGGGGGTLGGKTFTNSPNPGEYVIVIYIYLLTKKKANTQHILWVNSTVLQVWW